MFSIMTTRRQPALELTLRGAASYPRSHKRRFRQADIGTQLCPGVLPKVPDLYRCTWASPACANEKFTSSRLNNFCGHVAHAGSVSQHLNLPLLQACIAFTAAQALRVCKQALELEAPRYFQETKHKAMAAAAAAAAARTTSDAEPTAPGPAAKAAAVVPASTVLTESASAAAAMPVLPSSVKVRTSPQPSHVQYVTTTMLQVVHSPHPKAFELACALAFMSGRSLAELLGTGAFTLCNSHGTYRHCILLQSTEIPLLCDPNTFLAGLQRLRHMRPAASAMTDRQINRSHSKSANAAVKMLVGTFHVFSDLRALFAALTYNLYCRRSALQCAARKPPQSTMPQQLKAWLTKCMPRACIASRSAFLDKVEQYYVLHTGK